MNNFTFLKNIVYFWTVNSTQEKNKTEVSHDKNNISGMIYADTNFFLNILFASTISPCETWEEETGMITVI